MYCLEIVKIYDVQVRTFLYFELQFIFIINTDNDNREIHVNAYTVIMIGRCSVRGRGR